MVQVPVYHLDTGGIIICLDDYHRDRVIQLHCNIMPPVTGQQLQTAALPGPGLDWFVDAVLLDGFKQIPVVLDLPVDGEGVV